MGQENMTNPREPAKKNSQQNEKKQNQPNIKSVHPPKPVKKTPSRTGRKAQIEVNHEQQKAAARKNNLITISILTAVVLIVVAVTVYLVGILPMQRTMLTVGTENVSARYFIKRTVASASRDPLQIEQGLVNEMTVKQKAAANGVALVTAQDIDDFMRNQAKGTNDSISDADFNAWIKKQLGYTGLSESEYRDIMSREIQQQRLSDILATKVPDTAPQVHLWSMVFSTQQAANAVKALVDGGTDFTKLASTDTTGWINGGDQGWNPVDAINSQLQSAVNNLSVGKCSDAISVVQSADATGNNVTTQYVLLWISEKSDSMKVTDDQLKILKNNALSDWLRTQEASEKIAFYGLNGSTTMDTATTNWISSKVKKLVAKLVIPTTTPTPATSTTTSATVPTTPTAASTTTGTTTK
jgi:hypothetical protein